ncbi:hypothetical protein LTR17_000432 [Elasticomyces elasticus]|nr:hypothetical protein LTR17_000432 [Elasticomyces elasticus]
MPDRSSQMRRPQFGGLPDSPGAAATPTRPSSLRDLDHSNVYRTQGSEITTFNSGLAAPPDTQFNRPFAFPGGYRDSMPPLPPSFNTQQMPPPPSNRPLSGGRRVTGRLRAFIILLVTIVRNKFRRGRTAVVGEEWKRVEKMRRGEKRKRARREKRKEEL